MGQAFFCDGSPQQAVLWQNGSIVNLNSFVPAGSDLTLIEGNFVNERGEIVGTAFDANGLGHAFMLVPCGANAVEGCLDATQVEAAANRAAFTRQNTLKAQRLSAKEIVTALRGQLSQRHRITVFAPPRN